MMRNFKDRSEYIGHSQSGKMLFRFPDRDETIHFDLPSCYSAYIVDGAVSIPCRYRLVAKGVDSLQIYDDGGKTAHFEAGRIEVYRCSMTGILIRLLPSKDKEELNAKMLEAWNACMADNPKYQICENSMDWLIDLHRRTGLYTRVVEVCDACNQLVSGHSKHYDKTAPWAAYSKSKKRIVSIDDIVKFAENELPAFRKTKDASAMGAVLSLLGR